MSVFIWVEEFGKPGFTMTSFSDEEGEAKFIKLAADVNVAEVAISDPGGIVPARFFKRAHSHTKEGPQR